MLSDLTNTHGIFTDTDVVYKGFTHFLEDIQSYECTSLTGGLSTSSMQRCTVNGKKYVVRMLNGSFSVRKNEILTHVAMAKEKIAPHIYYYDSIDYSFAIMEFIDGCTLTVEQAQQSDMLERIAQKIRFIHGYDPAKLVDSEKVNMFDAIVGFYEQVKQKNPILSYCILDQALLQAKILYERIELNSPRLVFSHNDIHMRNVFCVHNDALIIDWEAVAINYNFFDGASYSLYACLNDLQEHYLLFCYLKRKPLPAEIQSFKDIKSLIMLYTALWLLKELDDVPADIILAKPKSFGYYGKIFAENYKADSPDFLFEMAVSLLQGFFKEYECLEKQHCSNAC
jgi:thiamine kinase-like enzyme